MYSYVVITVWQVEVFDRRTQKTRCRFHLECGVVWRSVCARHCGARLHPAVRRAHYHPLTGCGVLSSPDGSGCRRPQPHFIAPEATPVPSPPTSPPRSPPAKPHQLPTNARAPHPPVLPPPSALSLLFNPPASLNWIGDFLLLIVVYCSTPAATNQARSRSPRAEELLLPPVASAAAAAAARL